MAWANSNHLYQLDDYAELQVTTREKKAKPALESVVEKIQQVSWKHSTFMGCMVVGLSLLTFVILDYGPQIHMNKSFVATINLVVA